MREKGRFIVLEGIDGSGKSTQAKRIAERLADLKVPVAPTFEPSEGPIGTMVRQMLSGRMITDQRTIALLFAADRTDHLVNPENGVCRHLDQGRIVICDRYYFSSYAYHSQYVDMDWVIRINAESAEILRPDLNVFVDVEPKVCLDRILSARDCLDIYEKNEILEKVRKNYLTAFERMKHEEHVVVVDGNGSEQEVEDRIWEQVKQILPA